jgi:hypothetical protein
MEWSHLPHSRAAGYSTGAAAGKHETGQQRRIAAIAVRQRGFEVGLCRPQRARASGLSYTIQAATRATSARLSAET